jgi:hypothetical protein
MSKSVDVEEVFFAALANGTAADRTAFLEQTCRRR